MVTLVTKRFINRTVDDVKKKFKMDKLEVEIIKRKLVKLQDYREKIDLRRKDAWYEYLRTTRKIVEIEKILEEKAEKSQDK